MSDDMGAVLSAVQQYGDDRVAAAVEPLNTEIMDITADLVSVTKERDTAIQNGVLKDQTITGLNARIRELQSALDDCMNPRAATLIGLNTGGSIPSNVQQVDVARIYYAPTEKVTTWTAKSPINRAVSLGAKRFHISVRTKAHLDALETFRASVPDGVEIAWTWQHEQEGAMRNGLTTLADFKAGCATLAAFAHAHGDTFGPIHNGSNPRGRVWGLFPELWAEAEADISLYDWWGLDAYDHDYGDPLEFFAPAIEYAKSLGLPLVIGECGTDISNPNAQQQWAMNLNAAVHDRDNNIMSAMWWTSSTDKGDWRLTPESASAWLAQ